MRGFERTSSLLGERIRTASEARGFAVTRLLTHWTEIAGEEVAAVARPVNVHYGRESLGATLTLLTTGAFAPILEMQKESLRSRVNACYGYAAISRIKLTQTSPDGFAEGPARFAAAPPTESRPDPQKAVQAAAMTKEISDDGLRAALEALGENVLSRPKRQGDLT